MEALLKQIEKLRVSINTEELLRNIFADTKFQQWLLDTIRWRQLYDEGVSEENVKIGTYSPYTYRIKVGRGEMASHITLHDTGEFYESMRLYINPDFVVIDAEGEKTDSVTGITTNLFERYNYAGNLLGLTEKNWELMIEKLKPLILNQIWKSMTV